MSELELICCMVGFIGAGDSVSVSVFLYNFVYPGDEINKFGVDARFFGYATWGRAP